VVGHGSDISTNAPGGVQQRGAVLDLHADQRVSVVGAPDLRAVVQHAEVEAAPARGAVLQQDVREGRGDALLQGVHTQHVTVADLGLEHVTTFCSY
jgi:hypothetical protein